MEALRAQTSCPCKPTCRYEQFEPSLSFAQLSKFNIDRIVLQDPKQRAKVNERFLRARELAQRKKKDVAKETEKQLKNIRYWVDTLQDDIEFVEPALRSDLTFTSKYDIVSIIEYGDELFDADVRTLVKRYWGLEPFGERLFKNMPVYIGNFFLVVITDFMELDAVSGESTMINRMQDITCGYLIFMHFSSLGRRKKRSHQVASVESTNFYEREIWNHRRNKNITDCVPYLVEKQEFAADLWLRKEEALVDQFHISEVMKAYTGIFDEIFRNTTKSRYDFPKYQLCLDELLKFDESFWADIDLLGEGLRIFAEAVTVDMLQDAMKKMQESMESIAARDLKMNDLKSLCGWPEKEYLGKEGVDLKHFTKFINTMETAYLYYPAARISLVNIGDFAKDMYQRMEDEVVGSMQVITDYLENKATKMDLVTMITNRSLTNALKNLEHRANDFTSTAREFDNRFSILMDKVRVAFLELISMHFPIFDLTAVHESLLYNHVVETGLPQFTGIINRFNQGTASINDTIISFLDVIEMDYIHTMDTLRNRVPIEIEEIMRGVDDLTEELLVYQAGSLMNKAFYM